VEPVSKQITPRSEPPDLAAAFSASQKEGSGAFALDGRMIDIPLLKNAQKILDWAKAAGRLSYPCHCEGAALPPEAISCEVETFRIRRS